ncbi:single-stranded DNA-binding protein [Psychroflexus planctonicus]|uniref:Single-stranded DNA-binding protein n=1 Tax=Psychroflexus planctonicus TaxID=1526575 RepID=A0ABQ1SKI6_9FLAO|nr:single-stranded DNA-binding protein [Psychroflexus planctonicus]GGE40626.1 single-stranded DNA-binding protein [Psychroflexus planctonicus]
MAGTLNKVMLIGHTGDDVKMHYFDENACIGRFPLATNEDYVNKSTGERVSNTEWHNVVVRNKAAEICEKYLKKGDKVYIEGRIKTRKWQDDKGMDRYSTEVHCTEFTFLTPKDQSGVAAPANNQTAQPQNTSQPASQNTSSSLQNDEEEDDLPF